MLNLNHESITTNSNNGIKRGAAAWSNSYVCLYCSYFDTVAILQKDQKLYVLYLSFSLYFLYKWRWIFSTSDNKRICNNVKHLRIIFLQCHNFKSEITFINYSYFNKSKVKLWLGLYLATKLSKASCQFVIGVRVKLQRLLCCSVLVILLLKAKNQLRLIKKDAQTFFVRELSFLFSLYTYYFIWGNKKSSNIDTHFSILA